MLDPRGQLLRAAVGFAVFLSVLATGSPAAVHLVNEVTATRVTGQ